MSNNLFWTNMVRGEEDVAGLDGLIFSLTNGIQHTDETSTEVQEIDVHGPTVAGPKKAKEALKRRGGEACMETLDKMWAKKEAFDREKEKKKEERFMAALELEKKKVEADLMEKEDKIMSMDMTSSSLIPTQLQYYQIMQAKIIARRLSNQKYLDVILFETKSLV